MKQRTLLPLAIKLPFTAQAILQVLRWGAQPDTSPHSHKEIAQWCDRFWCRHLDLDPPEKIARLLPILADVETQWDLYLANTYKLEDLQKQSFEDVQLPMDWFQEWLRQAEAQATVQAACPASGQ